MAEITDPDPGRHPRADARRNRDQLLAAARIVVAEQGTEASLRDIARRAGVGLGTLYRHFPTRDALLEVLLRDGFARIVARADDLQASSAPDAALLQWLRELAAGARTYRGLPAAMLTTLNDPGSALWAACAAVREAAARLLAGAQRAGTIRDDVTDGDVLALVGAVAWIADQGAPIADRHERALDVLLDGLRPPATSAARTDVREDS